MHVAFADIANRDWAAGATYYLNLLAALDELEPSARPRTSVVLWSHHRNAPAATYRDRTDAILEVQDEPPKAFAARQVERVQRRLGIGANRPHPVATLLHEHRVDAMFACWLELGPSFDVPLLGWIPDFQHLHLPELFSPEENRDRDHLFTRMAANCSRVVLSSYDAQRDFERFSPEHASKGRVLQFVSQVPSDVYTRQSTDVCAAYHLPERFIYLPNQFWAHKGHGLVVEALALLKTRRPEITVVCTGNPSDNRDQHHFGRLLARVSHLGVRDSFVVLGWVPHEHTFDLMRQSLAVLQPSRFEGWSTTVEESKSLGKTIVLSDIAIHKEQDPPSAIYFTSGDVEALAQRLIEVFDTRSPGPDSAMEASARAALPDRTRAYAQTFMDIVRDATNSPQTASTT